MAEWFKALDLKFGGPWFQCSTLLLSGFVLGSPTWEVWRPLEKLELLLAIASSNSYASFVVVIVVVVIIIIIIIIIIMA